MADYRILYGFKMSLIGAFVSLSGGGTVLAADLRGSISLAAEEKLISGDKPYSGVFDLREQWGDNPQLTLTRLVVTFHFRDNDDWQMKERRGRPEKDGRPLRTTVKNLVGSEEPALEQHYIREVHNLYSNPIEVARLQIGSDRFFAATSRRRLEERHDHGARRSFLGIKSDPETGLDVATYSVTRRTLVEQWDGYADQFAIRNKILSLDALRDLAEDGVLPFTLDGEGDYLLVGATLEYEGYAYPGFNVAATEDEEFPLHVPLGLLGLIGGGGLLVARRKTARRRTYRREIARQKYGERRRAELEQMALEAAAEAAGQTS